MDNITCKEVGEMRGGKWESNIESARRVYDPAGLSPTCPTCGGGNQEVKIIEQPRVKIKNATKQGYLEAEPGDGIDISTRQNTHRGTVQKGMAQTIKTQCEVGVVEPSAIKGNHRIRKLTPKEFFRLMGVRDDDFERVAKNQSDSSLYHLAGDSIVVNVLAAIFKEML